MRGTLALLAVCTIAAAVFAAAPATCQQEPVYLVVGFHYLDRGDWIEKWGSFRSTDGTWAISEGWTGGDHFLSEGTFGEKGLTGSFQGRADTYSLDEDGTLWVTIDVYVKADPGAEFAIEGKLSGSVRASGPGYGICSFDYPEGYATASAGGTEDIPIDATFSQAGITSTATDLPGYSSAGQILLGGCTYVVGSSTDVVTWAQYHVELALSVEVRRAPIAIICKPEQSPAKVYAGEPVTFDGSTSHDPDDGTSPGQGIDTYEWSYKKAGDVDATTLGSSPTVDHAWDEPGTYDVTLTVTDDDDQTSSTSVAVEVMPITIDSARMISGHELEVTVKAAAGSVSGHGCVSVEVGGSVYKSADEVANGEASSFGSISRTAWMGVVHRLASLGSPGMRRFPSPPR